MAVIMGDVSIEDILRERKRRERARSRSRAALAAATDFLILAAILATIFFGAGR